MNRISDQRNETESVPMDRVGRSETPSGRYVQNLGGLKQKQKSRPPKHTHLDADAYLESFITTSLQ